MTIALGIFCIGSAALAVGAAIYARHIHNETRRERRAGYVHISPGVYKRREDD